VEFKSLVQTKGRVITITGQFFGLMEIITPRTEFPIEDLFSLKKINESPASQIISTNQNNHLNFGHNMSHVHEFFSKIITEKSLGTKKKTPNSHETLTKYEQNFLQLGANRIMVVAHLASSEKMETVTNQLVGKSIFKFGKTKVTNELVDLPIQTHHDTQKNVIHLFFSCQVQFSSLLSENIPNNIQRVEKLKLRALSFIFQVSHVIFV
jgi:hypothetical protein